MKIAVVGDVHFCARNASKVFNDYFIKSFTDFYLPHMKEHGIKTIIQLGDLFDVRKHTSNLILKEVKARYFDVLEAEGFEYHTLAGNHDLYWKESLDVVTQDLVLKEYKNVHVYKKPTTTEFDGVTFDIIPWICSENESEVMELVKNSKSQYCIGHFEFGNFSMYRGQVAHDGMDHKIFKRYKQVWSGHYHTRSEKDNVIYTGIPHEITLQDAGDPKGYYIFDTDDLSFTFYENPYTIFSRIEWDNNEVSDYDYPSFTNKYVRLVVTNKSDQSKFDAFLQNVYGANPLEVKIIEDMSEFKTSVIDETIDLEDTQQIMESFIDNLESDVDKIKLKSYLKTLYTEAVNRDV